MPAIRARPTTPPTTPPAIAPVFVWDEDEDVLPEEEEDDEEEGDEPVDEGDEDGEDGKLETAKTAEREGFDQLGVRLLVCCQL